MDENTDNTQKIAQAIDQEPLLAALPQDQKTKLTTLVELLVEGQKHVNLTAIRDPLAMVRYHLADSMALLNAMENEASSAVQSAVDIGTGGGFPLLPMAIVRPDILWTGIESVQKKAAFVEDTATALQLNNVKMQATRAEDAARSDLRENVDLVTARAVGPVASLLEVGIPLLKIGGRICLFKTKAVQDEWNAVTSVLNRLGAQATQPHTYSLHGDEQPRIIFIAQKTTNTPKEYPRRAGVPFKKPLI